MLDPNFPDRLLKTGLRRTTEFIQFISENYSRRGLSEETDRCVAISGLEARIARARGCESRYGIFEICLHRNPLWQRSENQKTERIKYESHIVPSWSWMAYNGAIEFMSIPWYKVEWNCKLQFGERNHVLITDVGVFKNCSLEQREIRYTILDSSKAERGWVQYDTEVSGDLQVERCVVVGRELYKKENEPWNPKTLHIGCQADQCGRRVYKGWSWMYSE